MVGCTLVKLPTCKAAWLSTNFAPSHVKLDSAFKLAKDSIERKKKQRLEKAEEFYNNLISAYPETKFKDEVELINLALKEEINNYKG